MGWGFNAASDRDELPAVEAACFVAILDPRNTLLTSFLVFATAVKSLI